MNKKSLYSIALLVCFSAPLFAQTGCYSGDTDGSQWFEKTIEFNPAITLNYNSNRWDDILKFDFDFGINKIENTRGVSFVVYLSSKTSEAMSTSGVLEGPGNLNGGSHRAGLTYLHTNLNSTRYFEDLKDGHIKLGLGRSRSNEILYITSIKAKFCGKIMDGIFVDANNQNLNSNLGSPITHNIEPNITYRVTLNGKAIDEKGRSIPSVNINYIDPRLNKNVTTLVKNGDEIYIHTDGSVLLYYATESLINTGGHNLIFDRVNLGK